MNGLLLVKKNINLQIVCGFPKDGYIEKFFGEHRMTMMTAHIARGYQQALLLFQIQLDTLTKS